MKNRDIYWRRYKKHSTKDNDASVPFKIGTLGPHTFLPVAISCPISWISLTAWNLFPLSKVILVLGKARSCRTPNLGCRGPESPRWLDFLPKNSAPDVMHEQVHCCDEAANHQLLIAVAFWVIWIVSAGECSSLMQNLPQICCSSCSVILNAMATQYTCSLSGIYHPDWLVQWSHLCSHTCSFQSSLLACQITWTPRKPFSLY